MKIDPFSRHLILYARLHVRQVFSVLGQDDSKLKVVFVTFQKSVLVPSLPFVRNTYLLLVSQVILFLYLNSKNVEQKKVKKFLILKIPILCIEITV